MLLKNKNIVVHRILTQPNNVDVTFAEILKLQEISPSALLLYAYVKSSIAKSFVPADYNAASLAEALNLAPKTISNTLAILKKLKLLYIIKFRDEDNDPMIRIVLGQETCKLYDIGVKVTITSIKDYNKLIHTYSVFDSSLSKDERAILVAQINDKYEKL